MDSELGRSGEVSVKPSPPGVPGAVTDPSGLAASQLRYQGAGGDLLEAYLVSPRAAGTRPGIVVVHHAPGVDDHMRDVAARLANLGYDVIVPNLFTREGRAPNPTDVQEIIARTSALPDQRVLDDLAGAASWLRALPSASGRLGAIGFCMGGRYALLYACAREDLQAVVDCWGGFVDRATPAQERTKERPQPPLELVPQLPCPLLAAFGSEDDNPSPAVAARLEAMLKGVPFEWRVDLYQNAGHAFFNDRRPSYRPAAAALLWNRIVPHFERHLKAASGQ